MEASFKNGYVREFPSGSVVRTQRFHCQGLGSIPGQGTKIPQAEWCDQKEAAKQNKETKAVHVHWLAIHLHVWERPTGTSGLLFSAR